MGAAQDRSGPILFWKPRADHVLIVPSKDDVVRYSPDTGANFTVEMRDWWAGSVYTVSRLRKSQMRTVWSSLPVARWNPSGEKSIVNNCFTWPCQSLGCEPGLQTWRQQRALVVRTGNTRIDLPERRSHSRPMPPRSPVATKDPSTCMDRAYTSLAWPSWSWMHC